MSPLQFLQFACVLFLGLVLSGKVTPIMAAAAAGLAAFAGMLLEHFTAFGFGAINPAFKVVYMLPSKHDGGEALVDGCAIKEVNSQAAGLLRHLDERELVCIDCPLFDRFEKEWVLYGRPGVLVSQMQSEDSRSTSHEVSAVQRKKGLINRVASQLAGITLYGPAVIAPRDMDWKPIVHGRLDMMSGSAGARFATESVAKRVTYEAVMKLYQGSNVEGFQDLDNARIARLVAAVSKECHSQEDEYAAQAHATT